MESAMMDKKPHIKPYLYGMLAGFGAISLSIIFFFFIYRFEGFGDAVSKLTSILMPFIYGAVIAYLLKPVCNTVENFLHRLFPEKMKGLVSALSVAATLLFGLLVIYALFMMIIPQLVTSVTTLYYTARANLSNFIRWVNKLEFVADNEVIMDYVNKAYNAISVDLDSWIKNTLMPSMQNTVVLWGHLAAADSPVRQSAESRKACVRSMTRSSDCSCRTYKAASIQKIRAHERYLIDIVHKTV